MMASVLAADPTGDSHWLTPSGNVALDRDGPRERGFELFGESWLEQPILARFQWIVARYGEKPALDDGQRRLTYKEAWEVIARLTRRIADRVPAGRPVGILLPNGALFPIAALACLGAGRPYVAIDRNYPASYNDQVLSEAGLAGLILDGSEARSLDIPSSVAILDIGEALGGAVRAVTIAPSGGPAVILYTSGSTGRPKGICNDQRAILQRIADSTNSFHLGPDDRFILLGSPGTIAGVRDSFAALLNGALLRIADPLRVGITGALQVLRDERITICYAVPALWRLLLAAPNAGEAMAHLRIAQMAGDNPLASDIALCRRVLQPSCHIMIRYGSTESPTVFQWFVPPGWRIDKPRTPIGYPRPGVGYRLVDENGNLARDGEPGELVVRSRWLALGYWQGGKLEPGPFLPDPDDPQARILHTGDLIRLRPDGLAEMLGRKDRQIKIRGLRVDLGQIEAALRDCAGVADAAVIARRGGEEVSALIGFVAPRGRPGSDLADTVRDTVAARLPRHMRPAQIRVIDAIPRLPSFKLDSKTLEAIARQDGLAADAPQGSTDADFSTRVPAGQEASASPAINAIVGHAWAEVLDARSFAANIAWDAAGGDSLKALEFWFRLERAFGRNLPLDLLHANATPRALIAAIHAEIQDGAASSRGRTAEDGAPLLFLMPGIAGDEPLLAGFRAEFGGKLRFTVIQYPDWREMIDHGARLDAIVDSVVARIRSAKTAGPYALAGYSFGGFIAYEAARRLRDAGDQVGVLALIDSRRSGVAQADHVRRVRNLLARPRRLMPALLRRFVSLCIRRRWFGLLRATSERVIARDTNLSFDISYHLAWMLRVLALRGWQPEPIAVPTILFRSDDDAPGEGRDLGWGVLCENLDVMATGGTHASMLEPPHLGALRDRLVMAVELCAANSGHVESEAGSVTKRRG